MYILGIETSSPAGSVALARDERVVGLVRLDDGSARARDIVLSVEKLMSGCRVGKDQIALVAASMGPGSFTGVRVGVTCAKALAYALDVAATGVCSLEAMAWNLDGEDVDGDFLCPLRDARRGAVYGRIFQNSPRGWKPRSQVIIDDPEGLANRLPGGTMVFGSGVEAYPEMFSEPRFFHPAAGLDTVSGNAGSVARLGFRSSQSGTTVSPMELLPRYYRLTEVEERLAREC